MRAYVQPCFALEHRHVSGTNVWAFSTLEVRYPPVHEKAIKCNGNMYESACLILYVDCQRVVTTVVVGLWGHIPTARRWYLHRTVRLGAAESKDRISLWTIHPTITSALLDVFSLQGLPFPPTANSLERRTIRHRNVIARVPNNRETTVSWVLHLHEERVSSRNGLGNVASDQAVLHESQQRMLNKNGRHWTK